MTDVITLNTIAKLKGKIGNILKYPNMEEFPITIEFDESIESDVYEITIERRTKEVFVDSKGVVWERRK